MTLGPGKEASVARSGIVGRAGAAEGAAALARWRPALRVLGLVGFAALTALGARLAVPLPGTAVPFTFQVPAVLLAGLLLGPGRGAASQALYLAAGMAGLPVFAAGGGAAYLLGPTGGYLLAFPLAAAAAGGALRVRGGVLGHIAGGLAGVGVVHLGGVAWLSGSVGLEAALAAGVQPFLVGDVLKVALAVVIAIGVRQRASRLSG